MSLQNGDKEFLKEWVVDPIKSDIKELTKEFKAHVKNHNDDVNKVNVTLNQFKGGLKFAVAVIIPIVLMWVGSILL